MRRIFRLLLALTLVALTAAPAFAVNPPLNVQIFRPSAHPGDIISTMTSDVPDSHLHWSVSAMLNYGRNPLVFIGTLGNGTQRDEVIRHRLTLDLMGSFTLFEWVDIGLTLPVHLVNTGQEGGFIGVDPVPSVALGDLRLSPKIRIIRREYQEDGFGLAADATFVLPTGLVNPDAFVTDDFSFQPSLIGDFKAGRFLITLNLGARFRTNAQAFKTSTSEYALDVSHEFTYGLGAKYEVVEDWLTIMAEVYGATSDFTNENAANLEGLLAARITIPDTGVHVTVGGGSGFLRGYGNTKFRVFAGAGYAPKIVRDADEDGYEDEVDACVNDAEDFDGFEDEDGCPELDNDGDKIEDTADRCPNEAEDMDGYEDKDGCPELDNDSDGLPDATDNCPNEAEDMDGFEDNDGCPDLDNDADGFPDITDKCPLEPETLNGFEDEDGCPDQTLAKIENKRIVILDKVYFSTARATIKEESNAVLDAVVGILKANPQVKHIRIEGHTDDVGSDKRNLKLSQRRAEAVRDYLVAAGVSADIFEPIGYGETRPLVAEKTKEARASNRRVEFVILDQPEGIETK